MKNLLIAVTLFELVSATLRPSDRNNHLTGRDSQFYLNAFGDTREWKEFEKFRSENPHPCQVGWTGVTMYANCPYWPPNSDKQPGGSDVFQQPI